MEMKKEEKLVKEIIKKYGPVINLKESPYIMVEILRKYGPIFQDDGGLPPGGVPPEPPPGPDDRDKVHNSDILKEVLKLSRDVKAIRTLLQKG
jgi:hypothetical protein